MSENRGGQKVEGSKDVREGQKAEGSKNVEEGTSAIYGNIYEKYLYLILYFVYLNYMLF